MSGHCSPLLDTESVILFFRCMLVWQNSALKSCVQLSIWKVTDLNGVNKVGKWTLSSYLLLYNIMFVSLISIAYIIWSFGPVSRTFACKQLLVPVIYKLQSLSVVTEMLMFHSDDYLS